MVSLETALCGLTKLMRNCVSSPLRDFVRMTYSFRHSTIQRPGARFSKAPETFRARNAVVKSRTLRLQRFLIHIFLRSTEIPFIHELSSAYTSPFLHTDELKMALRARKGSGAFEKRAPGLGQYLVLKRAALHCLYLLLHFKKSKRLSRKVNLLWAGIHLQEVVIF